MLRSIELPPLVFFVKVFGATACLIGLYACLRLAFYRPDPVGRERIVHLGFVSLTTLAFYKLLAFVALLIAPMAGMTLAAYHVFEGTHETKACMKCHVMWPMGNDMFDPESQTLAARHNRNHFIATETQCYHCHADYGLSGSLEAKMDGFRHLARFTSKTYQEPIKYRGVFNNQNCLNCHAKTRSFERVSAHQTARDLLEPNKVSCLNCHGRAHPERSRRTPGHPDYAGLKDEAKILEALNR